MSIADKLLTLKTDFDSVFAAGKKEKDKEWADKVYADTVRFGNTNSISLSLPFVPDKVHIVSYDSLALSRTMTYNELIYARASFGRYGAMMGFVNSGGTLSFASLQNKSISQYISFSGNTMTFTPPQSGDFAVALFRDATYFVFAYRSGKSDEELLQAEIDSLGDGGGSVSFSEKRVLETVSEAEWQQMIASKQAAGWTFTLI